MSKGTNLKLSKQSRVLLTILGAIFVSLLTCLYLFVLGRAYGFLSLGPLLFFSMLVFPLIFLAIWYFFIKIFVTTFLRSLLFLLIMLVLILVLKSFVIVDCSTYNPDFVGFTFYNYDFPVVQMHNDNRLEKILFNCKQRLFQEGSRECYNCGGIQN